MVLSGLLDAEGVVVGFVLSMLREKERLYT
jgi:hypothetical protein